MNNYLQLNSTYPFKLEPLPYAYNAMEPYIDTETMQLHHDKHLQTYINNLNAALKDYPELQLWTLEALIKYNSMLPKEIQTAVAHNAGGVFNHNFYFSELAGSALKQNSPLYNEIVQNFGSYDNFKKQFTDAATGLFGSGYAWLVRDNGKLRIITTANQETPLPQDYEPVLNIDVWEHAYYLKHHNLRPDYITDWFAIMER